MKPAPLFLATAALCIFLATPATATPYPVVTIDPATQVFTPPSVPPGDYAGSYSGGSGTMFGWTFQITAPVTITRVGCYDAGGDGLAQSFQMGLWQQYGGLFDHGAASIQLLGTPSAGITVPAGTAAILNGSWRQVAITPLTLQPGTYELGGLFAANSPSDTVAFVDCSGRPYPIPPSPVNLTIGQYFVNFSQQPGLHPEDMLVLEDGLFLGPMLFTNVPEPATLSLLVVGTLALRARRRN